MMRNILKGFTLTELSITVIIISLIAAFAIPNYRKAMEKALEKQAFVKLKGLYGAMMIYKANHGAYPNNGNAMSDVNVIRSTLDIDIHEEPLNLSCGAWGTNFFCCATSHPGDASNSWRICYQSGPPPWPAHPTEEFFCNNVAALNPCPTCPETGCGF